MKEDKESTGVGVRQGSFDAERVPPPKQDLRGNRSGPRRLC